MEWSTGLDEDAADSSETLEERSMKRVAVSSSSFFSYQANTPNYMYCYCYVTLLLLCVILGVHFLVGGRDRKRRQHCRCHSKSKSYPATSLSPKLFAYPPSPYSQQHHYCAVDAKKAVGRGDVQVPRSSSSSPPLQLCVGTPSFSLNLVSLEAPPKAPSILACSSPTPAPSRSKPRPESLRRKSDQLEEEPFTSDLCSSGSAVLSHSSQESRRRLAVSTKTIRRLMKTCALFLLSPNKLNNDNWSYLKRMSTMPFSYAT